MIEKMNKKGVLPFLMPVLIGMIAIVGAYFLIGAISGDAPTLSVTDSGDDDGDDDSGSVDCSTAPTLVESLFDSQNTATSVTATSNYEVNGVYRGTSVTSFAAGDTVKILYNATSWIDTTSEEVTMKCGANNMITYIDDYTAGTIEVLEDSTTLTDGITGANNATTISAGGSDEYTVRIKGNDKDSTGDLIYVVELSSTQNVSDLIMEDASGNELASATIPSFYTDTLSSPHKQAFVIPANKRASQQEYDLTVVAKSGKVVTGAVYTTAYPRQAFVDTQGEFRNGKFIDADGNTNSGVEDFDGTASHETAFDYDFFIATS